MADLTVFSTVGEELAKLLSWFRQATSTFCPPPPTFPCLVYHAGSSEVPFIISVRCLQITVNSTTEIQSNVSLDVAVLKAP